MTKEDFPWVYERDNTPSRIISTLEALAVLISLKIKYGEEAAPHRSRITVSPTITDIRGNGAALNKLMTTKKLGIKALVEWSLREGNRQADALANGCYDGFNSKFRIPVDARSLKWEILTEAMKWAREAEEMFQKTKMGSGLPRRNVKLRKRRVDTRLRIRNPW